MRSCDALGDRDASAGGRGAGRSRRRRRVRGLHTDAAVSRGRPQRPALRRASAAAGAAAALCTGARAYLASHCDCHLRVRLCRRLVCALFYTNHPWGAEKDMEYVSSQMKVPNGVNRIDVRNNETVFYQLCTSKIAGNLV